MCLRPTDQVCPIRPFVTPFDGSTDRVTMTEEQSDGPLCSSVIVTRSVDSSVHPVCLPSPSVCSPARLPARPSAEPDRLPSPSVCSPARLPTRPSASPPVCRARPSAGSPASRSFVHPHTSTFPLSIYIKQSAITAGHDWPHYKDWTSSDVERDQKPRPSRQAIGQQKYIW